ARVRCARSTRRSSSSSMSPRSSMSTTGSATARDSGASDDLERNREDAVARAIAEGTIMAMIAPTRGQIAELVQPYLEAQPSGLGFAIGYASPDFANHGGMEFFGNVKNQFGKQLTLGRATPFEIASISKTFTAMLYALLIRASHPDGTLGDYISPRGPLPISDALATIKLDGLVNYTSGLPQDS